MSKETNIRELLYKDHRINFSFLLGDVTRLMRQAFDQEMTKIGLTRSQWHALIYVLRIGNLTQTELAGHLDIGRASAGLLVDQLEKGGFIKRLPDPNDRRIWRIKATEHAIGRADAIAEHAEALVASVFENISEKDMAQAHRLLENIRDNLTIS